MTRRTTRTAAALAGAAAAAYGAYALGTQADDGDALAEGSRATAVAPAMPAAPATFAADDCRGPGPGLSALADRLGVTEEKLRTALDADRDAQRPERRSLAADLAAALGMEAAKVEAAMGKAGAGARPLRVDLDDELAERLGKSEAAVRAALAKARDANGPAEFESTLAEELDVGRDEIRSALRAGMPDRLRRRGGPHGGPGFASAELAKELGVTEARLEDAFAKLRERHEAEHERRRAAMAERLAGRLGIDEAKVKAALEDLGPGPHRLRGPGGPGLGFGPPPGPPPGP